MGLLDHLWDDTVAGPRPDTGLGKLRKHNTFSFGSNSGKESGVASDRRPLGEDVAAAAVDNERVTRSIMIVRPPQLNQDSPPVSPAGSTPPISPAGSTPPVSPFARRKKIHWPLPKLLDALEESLESFGGILVISRVGVRVIWSFPNG